MPRKTSKITERWREASEELASATGRSPEDLRFSWEKTQDDSTLPTYDDLVGDQVTDSGFVIQTAPTNNPGRPRAQTIGYNPNTNVLVIVFRDGTWWQYNDVGPDVWLGLKSSGSTNDYLSIIEGSCSSHGPADMSSMSEGVKAQIAQNAQISSDIQSGDNILEKVTSETFNLRNFTAEELFKEYR